MSSKTTTTATKDEAKSALVPKLRFPEFRGADGWKQRQLAEITTAIFDGTHQTPTYTDEGVPFYSVENLVSGNANKFISRADYEVATKKNKPEKGDVLITRIGKIGYSQVVTWSHDFSIYVTLAVIKKDERFNSDFLNQFIQSALYQKEILSKSLLNAVPCKINMDSLRATRVFLASPAEQQKIAECLSSVDELMAAQARKVEALKTHKKGLMQQLFPREGETQPRLRFPEFQNAGDWEETELGKRITIKGRIGYRGYTVEDIVGPGEGAISLSPSNISDDGSLRFDKSTYITWEKYNESPEIIVEQGHTLLVKTASVGKVAFIRSLPQECTVNPQVVVLKPHSIDPYFLFLLVFGEGVQLQIRATVAGGAIPTLSQESISRFKVRIPKPPEQQKISECLSSVDELIAAQARKVDALKTHKKGLMQQLFPSPEEVEA